MDAPRQPLALREEDLDWISSQLFLIRTQLSALAERLEAMQQAHNRMQGYIRALEARARKDSRKGSHNKYAQPQPLIIMLESLDD
ncbi:unnamed protein product [Symbiodinium sp. CCMP2592]|nr:unnamed protein product [Symbiodinium sp. CCMP2592]